MASPQAENGHTDIANEILDKLCAFRIPGEVRQVIDCIIRKTYGWHKKEEFISNKEFVLMTGMKKTNVCRSLSKAITNKIIIKSDNGYRFNKNYDEWVPFISEVIKKDNSCYQKGEQKLSKRITNKPVLKKKKKYKENILPEADLKNHEKLLLWQELTGTELRKDLGDQVAAAERLEQMVGPPRLRELLQATRVIKRNKYGNTNLQIQLSNYTGLERNLEAVEGLMQGMVDNYQLSTPLRI